MTKKDVAELKRRFTKDGNTIVKLSGCYVGIEKEKKHTFTKSFQNLEENEYFKYLEIIKKVYSGKVGDSILTLDIPTEEEQTGGRQNSLMVLKSSELKQDAITDSFFNHIIKNYQHEGEYLILLFYDCYDVIVKTNDNMALDESEEVYAYITCAICPVEPSKPSLCFSVKDGDIKPSEIIPTVQMPESGFVFPDFNDRSSDIHSVMFYTKNTKEPHAEFMENILGCPCKRTNTEKKVILQDIFDTSAEADNENENLYGILQSTIAQKIEEAQNEGTKVPEFTLTALEDISEELGFSKEEAAKITKKYKEEVSESDITTMDGMYDGKIVEKMKEESEKKELVKEIATLKSQLPTKDVALTEKSVSIQVPVQKRADVKVEIVNSQKSIIIPVNDDEHVVVNGSDIA